MSRLETRDATPAPPRATNYTSHTLCCVTHDPVSASLPHTSGARTARQTQWHTKQSKNCPLADKTQLTCHARHWDSSSLCNQQGVAALHARDAHGSGGNTSRRRFPLLCPIVVSRTNQHLASPNNRSPAALVPSRRIAEDLCVRGTTSYHAQASTSPIAPPLTGHPPCPYDRVYSAVSAAAIGRSSSSPHGRALRVQAARTSKSRRRHKRHRIESARHSQHTWHTRTHAHLGARSLTGGSIAGCAPTLAPRARAPVAAPRPSDEYALAPRLPNRSNLLRPCSPSASNTCKCSVGPPRSPRSLNRARTIIRATASAPRTRCFAFAFYRGASGGVGVIHDTWGCSNQPVMPPSGPPPCTGCPLASRWPPS